MRFLLERRHRAPSSGMCKFSPTCKRHQSLAVSLHCQRAVESHHTFICHKITELLEQQYCIRFYLKLGDAQSETIWQIQQTSVGNVISIMWFGSGTITWKMTKHRWKVGHVAMSPIQAKRTRSCRTFQPRCTVLPKRSSWNVSSNSETTGRSAIPREYSEGAYGLKLLGWSLYFFLSKIQYLLTRLHF